MHNYIDIVEYLRNRMIQTVETCGDLTSPDVVVLSQRLDLFILQTLKQGLAYV